MAKRKGMSKKELRAPDEFQAFILELTEKYGNYWKVALAGLIIVLLIPVGITVYNYYKNNKENQAAMQYSMLLNKLNMDKDSGKKLKDVESSINKFKGTSIYYQVLLLKGEILYNNKKYKDAIDVFNEVISDSDRDEFKSSAKLDKGICYFEMNNLKKAEEIFSNLTNDIIVSADAKYYLALTYEKEGNFMKAKSYYQEIVDNAKDYPFYKIAELKLETL